MTEAHTLRPHPRSHGFRWRDTDARRARRLKPEHIRQFNDDGFFRLEGVLDEQEIGQVMAAIDPLEQERERRLHTGGTDDGISLANTITFTEHIVGRSSALAAFARHAVFKDISHDLIGADVRLYWDQSVYKKSGKPREIPLASRQLIYVRRASTIRDLLDTAMRGERRERLPLDRTRYAQVGYARALDDGDRAQMSRRRAWRGMCSGERRRCDCVFIACSPSNRSESHPWHGEESVHPSVRARGDDPLPVRWSRDCAK